MLSLEERLDFEPEPWEPEEGSKAIGEVVEVLTFDDSFNEGESYPVIDLLVDPANLAGVRIYGSRTVLRNELLRADPKPGDRLAVKYLGVRKEGTKEEYHSYKVVIQRWSAPTTTTTAEFAPPPTEPPTDTE